MDSFASDLRFGARMLLKNPGFTLVAVLTLAVGIGGNTAVFSFMNQLFLEPITAAELQRRATILSFLPETGLFAFPLVVSLS